MTCVGAQGGEKQGKVSKLSKNEVLMLNIGSMCTGARVIAVRFPELLSRLFHMTIIKLPDLDRQDTAIVHLSCIAGTGVT